MSQPSGSAHGGQPTMMVDVFDRAADIYDRVGVDFFSVFGAWLVDAAELHPGEQALDVGCGRGAVTLPAAAAVGPGGRVVAIDMAPRMVELLQRDLAAQGIDNVEVRRGDAQSPPADAGPFDCLLGGLVIFFLDDVPAALRQYRRLLRPGGRVAFSTFGADDPRWSWLAGLGDLVRPEHRMARDPVGPEWRQPDHLRRLLTQTGFTAASVQERVHVVQFTDVQQWVRWSQSHGSRRIWEAVPAERHAEMIEMATRHLDRMRVADGGITMRVTLCITTAVSP